MVAELQDRIDIRHYRIGLAGYRLLHPDYRGALQSISPSIYEAAALDNASRFKVFYKITLPMISPLFYPDHHDDRFLQSIRYRSGDDRRRTE